MSTAFVQRNPKTGLRSGLNPVRLRLEVLMC